MGLGPGQKHHPRQGSGGGSERKLSSELPPCLAPSRPGAPGRQSFLRVGRSLHAPPLGSQRLAHATHTQPTSLPPLTPSTLPCEGATDWPSPQGPLGAPQPCGPLNSLPSPQLAGGPRRWAHPRGRRCRPEAGKAHRPRQLASPNPKTPARLTRRPRSPLPGSGAARAPQQCRSSAPNHSRRLASAGQPSPPHPHHSARWHASHASHAACAVGAAPHGAAAGRERGGHVGRGGGRGARGGAGARHAGLLRLHLRDVT
jgi:hypothetical protein